MMKLYSNQANQFIVMHCMAGCWGFAQWTFRPMCAYKKCVRRWL